MHGITLHCRLVRLLNNSLSRVCTTGAPRCCQRPREDLQVACCAPRIWRNCHFLLAGDCQGIMPARTDHLSTVRNVYTERAQRSRAKPSILTAPALYSWRITITESPSSIIPINDLLTISVLWLLGTVFVADHYH